MSPDNPHPQAAPGSGVARATADEIAATLYFGSDEVGLVNGQSLTIDGGFTSAGLVPKG